MASERRERRSRPTAGAESTQGWSGDYEHDTREYYRSDSVADRYARVLSTRWRSPASATVTLLERRAVRSALTALGFRPGASSAIDVPAGTGKLTDLLSGGSHYVAVDVSEAMLRRIPMATDRVVADATALPIRAGAIDVGVSLRLYHRVPADTIVSMVSELLRVSRRGIVASYGGQARWSAVHRVVRAVTRRPASQAEQLSPAAFADLARRAGGTVTSDRSISGSVTAERVAAIVHRSAARTD